MINTFVILSTIIFLCFFSAWTHKNFQNTFVKIVLGIMTALGVLVINELKIFN